MMIAAAPPTAAPVLAVPVGTPPPPAADWLAVFAAMQAAPAAAAGSPVPGSIAEAVAPPPGDTPTAEADAPPALVPGQLPILLVAAPPPLPRGPDAETAAVDLGEYDIEAENDALPAAADAASPTPAPPLLGSLPAPVVVILQRQPTLPPPPVERRTAPDTPALAAAEITRPARVQAAASNPTFASAGPLVEPTNPETASTAAPTAAMASADAPPTVDPAVPAGQLPAHLQPAPPAHAAAPAKLPPPASSPPPALPSSPLSTAPPASAVTPIAGQPAARSERERRDSSIGDRPMLAATPDAITAPSAVEGNARPAPPLAAAPAAAPVPSAAPAEARPAAEPVPAPPAAMPADAMIVTTERLGAVRVAIDAADGLAVALSVDRGASAALLSAAVDRLDTALAASGQRLEALSVDVRSGDGGRRPPPPPPPVLAPATPSAHPTVAARQRRDRYA